MGDLSSPPVLKDILGGHLCGSAAFVLSLESGHSGQEEFGTRATLLLLGQIWSLSAFSFFSLSICIRGKLLEGNQNGHTSLWSYCMRAKMTPTLKMCDFCPGS